MNKSESSVFWLSVLGFIGFGFFANKALELSSGETFGLLIVMYIIAMYIYTLFKKEIKNNRVYYANPAMAGSFPNYDNITGGIKWTRAARVKSEEEGVLIDKFRFDKSVKNRFSLMQVWQEGRLEKDVIINPKALTRGALLIGQPGSGKTVFLEPILNQRWWSRALIHDTKGSLRAVYYDSRKDVINNPFDAEGSIWDLFEEARTYPQIIKPFFINLLNGVLNEKGKGFFPASVADRYIAIFNKVLVQNLDTKESWELFVQSCKKYFEAAMSGTQKSEMDVVSTMKLIFDFFEFQNFRIQEDAKTFTIGEFIKRKNAKLFLLNKQSYATFLNPYFGGFIAAYTNIFMDMTKDNTDEYTLFLLDEYLTFLPMLDEATLTTLHTLIRSKGGCLLPAVQYVPAHSKELMQKLVNSVDHLFVFQTADTDTIKFIKESLGKQEHQTISETKDGFNKSTQTSDLLTDDILKSLGSDYTHITYIPSRNILYKGYTTKIHLEVKHPEFIDAGYDMYLMQKYSS
ncbi:MAG: type IV secretion system DNA-binding domain-containing protein [Sulfurimonadaceae bacterium]|jgi:hypothetical protein|nr:type IV secretion system DNA-binding domain-containing protein [Sulfurimonadaceae bacterium]